MQFGAAVKFGSGDGESRKHVVLFHSYSVLTGVRE